MKSKKNQRLLALILSMVLMLSASISAMAEGDVQTEASGTEVTQNQTEGQDPENEASAASYSAEIPEAEEQETLAEQGTEETIETGEQTTPAETVTENGQTTEETVESQTVEEQAPAEETVTEKSEEAVSESAELKQEFTDENGNVTQTVTAYVPEGAFQATADQISMDVTLLNTDDENYIKGMMEELLPENYYLDGYVLYQIDFKVNGEITQPSNAITITMTGNDLAVEDTQKAHVFYYDPEDPEVEDDKDQLVEVTQKDQLIKSLEESGESTENIEDYDYSEITVNEGNADTITVKGWESTIYGSYVEKEAATELTYEDDSVTVTVSADQAGIIPEGAELSVTPIQKTEITDDMSEEEKAQAKEINAQYEFTEEKLKEDSEENDTTMEGFLAYDICFLVDGEEVEPGGDVKVVMDFKEAAVPEGVSEDAEVTVKHLKEDESAEDGIVVEDIGEKADIQTTEETAIQKVEMTAVSFSIYTIYWGQYNTSRQLQIRIVDTNGDSIGQQNGDWEAYTGYDGEEKEVSELAKGYQDSSIENDYIFQKALVGTDFETATEIKYLRSVSTGRYSYQNQYRVQNGNWTAIENNTVWFVYEKLPPLAPIETVDTKDLIDISLYDYDYTESYNGLYFNGTKEDNMPNYNGWIGNWTIWNGTQIYNGDDERAVQGIMGKQLYTADGSIISTTQNFDKTGYPVVADQINGNTSTSLFSQNQRVASEINHLFTKDADGYYEYNSAKNYAYYNDNQSENPNKDFIVYNRPASKGDDEDGDFMPLLPYSDAADASNRGDWYYGMTVSFNFVQPQDGMVNGQPMVFEFSGDDDVWVFVDGQLVLDIGGIHGATSGTINFATGEVTVQSVVDANLSGTSNSAPHYGTTIDLKDIFEDLNGEDTFEDFTEHRLDFYYLERGAGDSNCHLRFNMPPKPDKTIIVGKEITDANAGVYSDVEFTFQVETKNSNDSWEPVKEIIKTTDEGEELSTKNIEVFDDSGNYLRTIQMDNDGKFKLKDGEWAYLTGFPDTTIYRVTELDVSSSEYDEVTITGVTVEAISDVDGSGDKKNGYQTEALILSERSTVIFRNSIAASNEKELQITKAIADPDGDAEYQIHVFLGDDALEENGQPYTGEYWINGDDEKPQYATDGIIRLKKGQTATIVKIPSGTSFKVEEINLDEEVYESPEYRVENADSTSIKGAATGKMILTAHTQVTVTNSLKSTPDRPYIKLQKTFEGLSSPSDELKDFQIGLYEENDTDLSNPVAVLKLSDKNDVLDISEDGLTYTWTIYNLPAGTYMVKETGVDTKEYILDKITINGTEYTSDNETFKAILENGLSIGAQEATYKFVRGERISPNNSLEVELDYMPNVVAGALTSSAGYFVWTNDTLSSSERTAIISLLKSAPNNGNFGNITEQNTVFFSTENKIEEGIDYRGKISLKQENDKIKLIFSKSSQWKQIYYASYEKTENINAEIEITNSYKPKTTEIDIQKYGTRYDTGQISGAKFSLYEWTEENGSSEWMSIDDYTDFDVTKDTAELTLKTGRYKLEETLAPTGYQKLSESIYFKVVEGKAVLTDEDGNPLNLSEEEESKMMWKTASNGLTIMIKNNAVYDLPSAGGPGIFLYMIGGTLLLMAGSLMIYINRRKGVLKR